MALFVGCVGGLSRVTLLVPLPIVGMCRGRLASYVCSCCVGQWVAAVVAARAQVQARGQGQAQAQTQDHSQAQAQAQSQTQAQDRRMRMGYSPGGGGQARRALAPDANGL